MTGITPFYLSWPSSDSSWQRYYKLGIVNAVSSFEIFSSFLGLDLTVTEINKT